MDEYPDSRQWSAFQEPPEVTNARNKAKANALREMPIMERRVKELAERVKSTDSIQRAFQVAKEYDITTEQALVVLDVVRQQLEAERSILQDLVSTYKR